MADEQPERRQKERRQANDRRHVERRRNWDGKAADRLADLERRWHEQRVHAIREELHDSREDVVRPTKDD